MIKSEKLKVIYKYAKLGKIKKVESVFSDLMKEDPDYTAFLLSILKLSKKIDYKDFFRDFIYINETLNIDENIFKKYTECEDVSNCSLLYVQEGREEDEVLNLSYLLKVIPKVEKFIYLLNPNMKINKLLQYNFFKHYNFDNIEISTEKFEDVVEKYDINYLLNTKDVMLHQFENNLKEDKYIHVNVKDVDIFKNNFVKKDKYNIGISCSIFPFYTPEMIKEIVPFIDLADIDGVQLYSIQYGQDFENLNNCKIENLSQSVYNLYDMALAIESMDLIISVDNVILSLAAGLGKKTLAFLPYSNSMTNYNNYENIEIYNTIDKIKEKVKEYTKNI